MSDTRKISADALAREQLFEFVRIHDPMRRIIPRAFRFSDQKTLARFVRRIREVYGETTSVDPQPPPESQLWLYGVPFQLDVTIPVNEIHLYSLTDHCIGIIEVDL